MNRKQMRSGTGVFSSSVSMGEVISRQPPMTGEHSEIRLFVRNCLPSIAENNQLTSITHTCEHTWMCWSISPWQLTLSYPYDFTRKITVLPTWGYSPRWHTLLGKQHLCSLFRRPTDFGYQRRRLYFYGISTRQLTTRSKSSWWGTCNCRDSDNALTRS